MLGAVALGLGMDEGWFARTSPPIPTVLFRIFHYPPAPGPVRRAGAHRLRVVDDPRPGRHARAWKCTRGRGWIDVPVDPDVLVVNHRRHARSDDRRTLPVDAAPGAQPVGGRSALLPVFFDPSWDATCPVLPLDGVPGPAAMIPLAVGIGASVHAWDGTYGEYLSAKVAHVFPALFTAVTDQSGTERANQ